MTGGAGGLPWGLASVVCAGNWGNGYTLSREDLYWKKENVPVAHRLIKWLVYLQLA